MHMQAAPGRAHTREDQMLDELKDELELIGLSMLKSLIFGLVHIVWFVLLVLAFPYVLEWFLWPLGQD